MSDQPRTWRGIESAPKDGTLVLLWWPFWCVSRPTIGWFGYKGIQQWMAPEALEGDGDGPTHWAPLPSGPATDPPSAVSEAGTRAPLDVEAIRARVAIFNEDVGSSWSEWEDTAAMLAADVEPLLAEIDFLRQAKAEKEQP